MDTQNDQKRCHVMISHDYKKVSLRRGIQLYILKQRKKAQGHMLKEGWSYL